MCGSMIVVWNQDDTIAVKDDSKDMVFERVKASGVLPPLAALAAPSCGTSLSATAPCPRPKGIYLKFRIAVGGEAPSRTLPLRTPRPSMAHLDRARAAIGLGPPLRCAPLLHLLARAGDGGVHGARR